MLTPYCAEVLRRELAGADYAGLTAEQGWAWLMLPVAQPPVSTPTGVRLTPVTAAGAVGAVKAEVIAAAVKAAYPTVADHLLQEGIDPLAAETGAFLDRLVRAGAITAGDKALLVGVGLAVTQPPPLPRRFDERFTPARWPHVAADGTAGGPDDPPVHEFPNDLTRAEFDAAWAAAGRPA